MHVSLSGQSRTRKGFAHLAADRNLGQRPPARCSRPMYTSLSASSARSRRQALVGNVLLDEEVGAGQIGPEVAVDEQDELEGCCDVGGGVDVEDCRKQEEDVDEL